MDNNLVQLSYCLEGLQPWAGVHLGCLWTAALCVLTNTGAPGVMPPDTVAFLPCASAWNCCCLC